MMGHSLRRALRAMDKESQWTPGDVLLESGSCGAAALPALCAACHTESFSWVVGGLRLGKGTMIECAQHARVHRQMPHAYCPKIGCGVSRGLRGKEMVRCITRP